MRTGKEEQERLCGELALYPDPPDPAVLIATIDQAKSLVDTDHAIARLKSDIERLTASATRDLKLLRQWSGSIQELESLKAPLLTSIDKYGREWEAIAAARRETTSRLSEIAGTIQREQVELDRLAAPRREKTLAHKYRCSDFVTRNAFSLKTSAAVATCPRPFLEQRFIALCINS